MDINVDVGENLTQLGGLYLIFKFLLPYFFGLLLIAIGIGLAIYLYNKYQDSGLSRQDILLGLIGAAAIALLFIMQ